MSYGEIEAKFLGRGEELTSEPCYKKLKSAAEVYVFPHHGSTDFHRTQEKSGNDWVPVTFIDVRGQSHLQKDKTKTTDLLRPFHDEIHSNRPDFIKSIDSRVLQDTSRPLVSTDDEIYSTSKAFIGPIYKPPEKKKIKEKRSEADTLNNINGKEKPEEKQKFNSEKSEIDNELSQFYKEIEELENEKFDLEGSCKEPETSQEQLTSYYQDHNNDLLKSDEGKKDPNNDLQSHCGYEQYLGNEIGKYPCNGQVIPTVCDISFTSLRPEWESVQPFMVPSGPPLPSFNYHLNTQRFSAPPNPPSDIFCAHDDSQMRNTYYVNNCHVNWNCSTFDQNNEYTEYNESSSIVHPSRSGYNVQDTSNGFCEIREGCWKGPSVDKHNGMDRFVHQQFQDERLNKLQKLLILLRGLPGSGKTTLSRILLGQSRDGIVFSTDDYFRHQDGYRYNVNQLGDAHDWNQNRAKQAINQGRSPVIIDNTNTQAWEMKPYVEMAIGKGYRVEFHEPETWWKFDPEELEKRNKHGVSRKKIAQMLDCYEYQMSISIVMNSVEPSHKNTLRPPPPQEKQRERVLKKTGHRLSKTKQKRNRKRNKKHNSHSKIMEENSFGTSSYIIQDQDPTQSEEEDVEETKRESGCPLTSGLKSEVGDFLNDCKEKRWTNTDPEDSFSNNISIVELDNTSKNDFSKEDDNLFLALSSKPNESSVTYQTVTPNLFCVTNDDCMKVEKHIKDKHTMASDIQDLFIPCPFMPMREVIDKSLPNEPILCHPHGSRTSENVLREEQRAYTTKSSYWAVFTTNLSKEELQLGSARQPYFDKWPEGPHKFIYEQKPKKDRSRKHACLDSKEQLIQLISTSEGPSEPGSSPEILTREKLLIAEDLLPPSETIDSFIVIEKNIFRSYLPQLDIPKSAEATKNEKRMQNRIFNLAPYFNLLGQSLINANEREKHSLSTQKHELKIILQEKDRISEINNDENKQNLMTLYYHSSWFYLVIINDPRRSTGRFYSNCLSFNRLRHFAYFYKNPILSLTLRYITRFWKASLRNKKPFLTFKSQTSVDKNLNDVQFISSEILSSQPDILCSLRAIFYFLNERLHEKLKRLEKLKSLHCLPFDSSRNLTSTKCNSLGLPLSQEFAFQLVELFGSPGVPIESLLPNDYVVPLDWKTLKMIYLQWKTSMEQKQKKIA
ncbi:NEDD4-binding protein 2-like 2 isoform X1 [Tupaia chinensis]|uniref:NEDD4-binding protein 2-like 2 isoform X1 n=1 Tax=Tupaia chinensis TaxID=246437 RepID=UPI0003C8CC8E|nr:NEDD4-binding protein 2-like 2 isoform X1 [Tupaia chinensis]